MFRCTKGLSRQQCNFDIAIIPLCLNYKFVQMIQVIKIIQIIQNQVPLELIEWQPVYHQRGATGVSGGEWSANWEVTKSTKVRFELQPPPP